ncbi:DUF3307 domain-containing protein [Lentzea sp. NPDC092896]|uniref:DUF3307 domain-containing protein n=1 Tax=Lentzea sp. NPDC092896 TaxID=3364127 RepID=UPI003826E6D5
MTLAEALFWATLAHFVGDYVLQSHWMATSKTSSWLPAIVHAITYGVPFLFVTQNLVAVAVIVGTHAVIDRYRLARYLVWLKNFSGPRGSNPSWSACSATGYPPETPAWLAVGLMIVVDNTLHILINSVTIAATWP